MARTIVEKLKNFNPFTRRQSRDELPRPLPPDTSTKLVRVYVEGYEDVAFWRGIFDHFRNPYLRFEISVPNRADLPKGKKVLMGMIPKSSEELLLCVDSDFDYLFGDYTQQSRDVNGSRYMFHTYTYATENYLCYAPSLHNVCVKATKNDTRIFDFVLFMANYSKVIYPMFVWYATSALHASEAVFTLADFKATVRISYLEVADNGAQTLAWLQRNVAKREAMLRAHHPKMAAEIEHFEQRLRERGVTPETTYLYMHGHTLMDNVVLIALNSVCEKLRQISIARINSSKKEGVALQNEMSNYNNSLRSVRDVLLDNENYKGSSLYKRLNRDIEKYLIRTILDMKKRGELPEDSVLSIARRMRQE